MKWLAFLLLLIIAGLWFYGDRAVPQRVVIVADRQSLPRVADLRTDRPEEQASASGGQEPQPEEEVLVPIEPVNVPDDPEPQRYCVRLGWFESAEDAQSAYESMGSPGSAYEVLEEERELPSLHWVIIPPQPEDRALELFRDLQRRGIDSYLIARGENKNAISLGLFESRQAAETVLEEKKRQNLNAILANFPRNQLSYALVFEDELMPESGAVEAAESDYASNFDLVEIRRCEGIATAYENP